MIYRILLNAAALSGAVASLYGQNATADKAYQIFIRTGAEETTGIPNIPGKPFSATEEKHSLQVLSDGTRIESKQTTRVFRDGQGRTRLEDVIGAGQPRSPGFEFGSLIITDPVAGTRVAINPENRTMLTTQSAGLNVRGGVVGAQVATIRVREANGVRVDQLNGKEASRTEALGTRNVNGVMARGERTTVTIPSGEIGNNREIRVVTERWYSEDLQMLIKSTNTDPRFGDTEYQLSGISTSEPNPSLFQPPTGYTEAPGGRGGGRGGARGGGPAPVPPPAPPPPGGRGPGRGKKQE